MMVNKKILIVGGGIAGPALAIYCHRLGAEVTLLESRNESELDEGLFLGISPNGLCVLSDLIDLSKLYREYSPGAINFFNAKGKKIAELDTDHQVEKYGWQSIQVKRSSISRLLHNEMRKLDITVLYDTSIVNLKETDDQVLPITSNGNLEPVDLVFGADGIHSECRRIIFPFAHKPKYTHQLSTGSILSIPGWCFEAKPVSMTFGTRAFFGYTTSSNHQVWWFNNYYRKAEPTREEIKTTLQKEIKNNLIKLHEKDHPPIKELIRQSTDIFAYPIYDMPELEMWYTSNVCLVGDAAHATSPHIGQGASLALEDVAILYRCLKTEKSPQAAFARFQDHRKPRVKKIIQQARKVGNSKSKPNPVAVFFRDLFLRHFIKFEKKKMDWVYAYDALQVRIC
ncbi:FAD-dependent oxidoreductase [Salibacter halophilus]|uniref:FAD-dependent monooxygenase n=1 Tax=Salibacter halophilus TaxID=1803916 RepID=A0A6N6M8D1_9FLAO|nr:NAD(P)/FAD-dependent oxidoreductase [Salibacter halophilus]KAB1065115.1 FAD-dependent monooxygenase [Salibacter halophilus]